MKHILYLLYFLLICSACTWGPYRFPGVRPNDIRILPYFEPVALIDFIDKGDQIAFSDSLSRIAEEKMDSILTAGGAGFPLGERLSFMDQEQKERFRNELHELANLFARRGNVSGITLPRTVNSLLKSRDSRFGLATVAIGYGRSKASQRQQVVQSVAIGVLSGGTYVPLPVKSSIRMFAFVFDAELNQVLFFHITPAENRDPTHPEALRRHLAKLYKGFYYE